MVPRASILGLFACAGSGPPISGLIDRPRKASSDHISRIYVKTFDVLSVVSSLGSCNGKAALLVSVGSFPFLRFLPSNSFLLFLPVKFFGRSGSFWQAAPKEALNRSR
jgi:hypothetical protein